jgi:hypothetical protein
MKHFEGSADMADEAPDHDREPEISAGEPPVWPEAAAELAVAMMNLTELLDQETKLIQDRQHDAIGALAAEKQALGSALGAKLAVVADLVLDVSIREDLIALDAKMQAALKANERALDDTLASYDRILRSAARPASSKRMGPVGYGPGGGRPESGRTAGPSLLSGIKL